MFQMLFDLDELPDLSARLRLFSHNRFNAFSFYDADHGDGSGQPLRPYVEGLMGQAGLSSVGGKIRLLCMPRIFGHVFNPLSIYYGYGPDGDLMAMLYEVNNTFGQRHTYLIPKDASQGELVQQSCAKDFHVSPFMDMDIVYDFRMGPPGPTIATTVNGRTGGGDPMIFASFTGRRRELSDGALLRVLLAFPFLTLGVVVAIHWEAVKMLAKGLRLRAGPPAPRAGVTLVPPR